MTAYEDATVALAQQLAAAQQTSAVLAAEHASEIGGLQARIDGAVAELRKAVDELRTASAELATAAETIARLQARVDELEDQLQDWIVFDLCTHTTFRDSVYAQDAKLLDAVLKSGASGIRDQLALNAFWNDNRVTGAAGQRTLLQRYRDVGLEVNLTVGTYPTIGTLDRNMALARLREARSDDSVQRIAGVNEPDGDGRTIDTYLPRVVEYQKWLYTSCDNDWNLSQLSVGSGALRDANPRLEAELKRYIAAVDPWSHWHNLHLYPGPTRDVAEYVQQRVGWVREVSDKPIIVTEGGGTTANMSLETQARVVRELVQALDELGIRCAVYEALDDPNASGTDVQSNFGVYESDYSDKPAVVELRKLGVQR